MPSVSLDPFEEVKSLLTFEGNVLGAGSSPCRHMLLEGDGVLVLTKYPLAICKENLSEHILIRYLRCMKTVLPGQSLSSSLSCHCLSRLLSIRTSFTVAWIRIQGCFGRANFLFTKWFRISRNWSPTPRRWRMFWKRFFSVVRDPCSRNALYFLVRPSPPPLKLRRLF